MTWYRKRPISVQAFQMTDAAMNGDVAWPDWLAAAGTKDDGEEGALHPRTRESGRVTDYAIYTLEGPHIVILDAWIVQGPAPTHEIWAVRDDIFRATYEEVETQ